MAVAELLASLQVHVDVIIAGLLHDTVEDNPDINFLDLEVLFGSDVRGIVEGETKASKKTKVGGRGLWSDQYLSLYKFVFGRELDALAPEPEEVSKARVQFENLRDMFLAMADDYRVILVKLADRLHNMRTLQHMSEKKRKEIASETLAIFAPLAHRLGVWLFKTELEDLAFKFVFPKEFLNLDRLLGMRRAMYTSTLTSAACDLTSTLENDPKLKGEVRFQITSREKGMYSLWYKMLRKKLDDGKIDQITDIIALRVVLEVDRLPDETDSEYEVRSNDLCYYTLSIVNHLPKWNCPDEPTENYLKDYIKYPKPNGYKSLHTILVHSDVPVPLEVQIRTQHMHDVAEYGMAAHWAYKGDQHGKNGNICRQVAWLASLADKDGELGSDPKTFVQEVLREELGKRCFVFLRDGKILNLSRGCTALDAAFKIHTEVGLHMLYPVVNGNKVNPYYTLQNGDRVSIITSAEACPKPEWLSYCWLRSTRNKLAAHFRKLAKGNSGIVDLGIALATAASAAALPLF